MGRFFRSILPFCAAVLLLLTCSAVAEWETCSGIVPMRDRSNRISIADFGGIGDGRMVNTKAFMEAIYQIQHLNRSGGTLLYIPAGVYLTGPFNLASHMTLFLDKDAVIKATQDTTNWPLIPPLPSYGRGRELPGDRYMSFIHGDGLRDVIITGENGTIDGQGDVWWNMWRQRTLQFTRPNLIELMNSRGIIISNVIFKNSPFWNIHPVYCSNVVVRYVTILAPTDSPNTDGIDPDSSTHVCIEDSYISTGDDLVAVKSGWDEYGIAYGRPSHDITIRRVTGSSPFAGIAVGSETSGGVSDVLAEHINLSNMGVGIHIKTNIGRGGIIRNITFSNVYMEKTRTGIKISGDVGGHPDDQFNPNALPVVQDIRIKDVWGESVLQPGLIRGILKSPFTNICLSNVNLNGPKSLRNPPWKCSDASGAAIQTWMTSGNMMAPLEISRIEALISKNEYTATIAFVTTTNLTIPSQFNRSTENGEPKPECKRVDAAEFLHGGGTAAARRRGFNYAVPERLRLMTNRQIRDIAGKLPMMRTAIAVGMESKIATMFLENVKMWGTFGELLCKLEIEKFMMVEFSNIFREQNRVVDSLASMALSRGCGVHTLDVPSAPIINLLEDDQRGVLFTRQIEVGGA